MKEFGILMHYTNYRGCKCVNTGALTNSKFTGLAAEKYQ